MTKTQQTRGGVTTHRGCRVIGLITKENLGCATQQRHEALCLGLKRFPEASLSASVTRSQSEGETSTTKRTAGSEGTKGRDRHGGRSCGSARSRTLVTEAWLTAGKTRNGWWRRKVVNINHSSLTIYRGTTAPARSSCFTCM